MIAGCRGRPGRRRLHADDAPDDPGRGELVRPGRRRLCREHRDRSGPARHPHGGRVGRWRRWSRRSCPRIPSKARASTSATSSPGPGSRTQVAFFEAWPPDRLPGDLLPARRRHPRRGSRSPICRRPCSRWRRSWSCREPCSPNSRPGRWRLRLLDDPSSVADRRRRSHDDPRSRLATDPVARPERGARTDGTRGTAERHRHRQQRGVRGRPACDPRPARAADPTWSSSSTDPMAFRWSPTRAALAARIPVEVVCATGAGDALTAAFAAGLLNGLDPLVAVERGNAAGAIVATRLMCSTAMPTPAEIDRLLADQVVESHGARP